MDLEGLVAKRKDGLYTPEASWVKSRARRILKAKGGENFSRRGEQQRRKT